MIPNKSHLQVIVKELEKFESELEKSYNFQEFLDRCAVIFDIPTQEQLNYLLREFKAKHLIDTLTAQNILYKSRVMGLGGRYVLHLKYDDKPNVKVPLSLNSIEYSLRGLVIWCRKQVVKMIKDEQVEFDKVANIDLENE